jgi:hypothetical protein
VEICYQTINNFKIISRLNKYIGFVMSNDASNVANIEDKRGKSVSTSRSIMSMVRGLDTNTFQCWLTYLHSLLPGTTLYANETYYSLSELDKRILESYDESLLMKSTKTGFYFPQAVLYLDFGLWPARVRIEENKLNFLHYILNENENSLLYRFFDAQLKYPVRGEWVS